MDGSEDEGRLYCRTDPGRVPFRASLNCVPIFIPGEFPGIWRCQKGRPPTRRPRTYPLFPGKPFSSFSFPFMKMRLGVKEEARDSVAFGGKLFKRCFFLAFILGDFLVFSREPVETLKRLGFRLEPLHQRRVHPLCLTSLSFEEIDTVLLFYSKKRPLQL